MSYPELVSAPLRALALARPANWKSGHTLKTDPDRAVPPPEHNIAAAPLRDVLRFPSLHDYLHAPHRL